MSVLDCQYRTIRVLSLPRRGVSEYLAVPVRIMRHGITRPELPGYLRQQLTISANGGSHIFYVYYLPLSASHKNINVPVLVSCYA